MDIIINGSIKLKFLCKPGISIPSIKTISQSDRIFWTIRHLPQANISWHCIRSTIRIICNPVNFLDDWIKVNIVLINRHAFPNTLSASFNQRPASQSLISSHFNLHIHDTDGLTCICLLNLSDYAIIIKINIVCLIKSGMQINGLRIGNSNRSKHLIFIRAQIRRPPQKLITLRRWYLRFNQRITIFYNLCIDKLITIIEIICMRWLIRYICNYIDCKMFSIKGYLPYPSSLWQNHCITYTLQCQGLCRCLCCSGRSQLHFIYIICRKYFYNITL